MQLLTSLARRTADPAFYPNVFLASTFSPTYGDALWDELIYRGVGEQMKTAGIEPRLLKLPFIDMRPPSLLRSRYAAAYESSSLLRRQTIDLLCVWDCHFTHVDTGAVIVAPSTVPGANLGAICVGSIKRVWTPDYVALRLTSADVNHQSYYVVDDENHVQWDGAVAASAGAAANSGSPAYEAKGSLRFDAKGPFVVLEKDLQSEELFVGYGEPVNCFDPEYIPRFAVPPTV